MKNSIFYLSCFLIIVFSCENEDSDKECKNSSIPIAKFEYSLFSCSSERKCAQFQNVSDSINSETKYTWTFGDGGESNLENPTHTYINYGDYNVVLKVVNCNGNNSFASDTVKIRIN